MSIDNPLVPWDNTSTENIETFQRVGSVTITLCNIYYVTLLKNIAAIELRPTEDGKPSLSAITRLPRDSEFQICGPGFNPRTVKVASSGRFYFVFLQDLDDGSVCSDLETPVARPAKSFFKYPVFQLQ